MVDVGCGVGSWVRAAADLGIADRLGIDGEYVEPEMLMIPAEQFMAADLAQPDLAGTISARHPDRFDLVLCLEVAEHLPFDRSAGLVADLCSLGDLVLFSAAIPFQHGTNHINEQWPEFWATLFRARGYACFDLLRPELWGNPAVAWWYAQNIIVFAREGTDAYLKLPSEITTHKRLISKVHPEAWLSSSLSTWHVHRASARDEELHDYRSIARSWTNQDILPPPLQAVERARTAPNGARDVFPYTRVDVSEPERLIAESRAAELLAQADVAALECKVKELSDELLTSTSIAHERYTRDTERLNSDFKSESDNLRCRLAATQVQADATRHDLERSTATLTVQQSEADAALARADLAKSKLEDACRMTAELKAANATLRKLLAARDEQLEEDIFLSKTMALLRKECDDLRAVVTIRAVEITSVRKYNNDLINSTSWRITAPIRMLKQFISNRRRC